MANAILSQELIRFRADTLKEDLEFLRELMQAGKVTSVIDRTYRLAEVPAAIEYLETGRARGKVVIVVDGPGNTSNSTASASFDARLPEARADVARRLVVTIDAVLVLAIGVELHDLVEESASFHQ